MPKQQRPSTTDILERCAREMHSVAFDFLEDARHHGFAEARIEEVERICAVARASVRGGTAAA